MFVIALILALAALALVLLFFWRPNVVFLILGSVSLAAAILLQVSLTSGAVAHLG